MSGSEGRLALVEAAPEEGLGGQVAQAITRATQYLATTQHALGYWQAPLEANVTMEAEYVFFNRILGPQDFTIAEAAPAEAQAYWDSFRPTEPPP